MHRAGIVGHRYWIAVVFLLLAAAPGAWVPVLANVLEAKGWDKSITWAFLLPPLAGMISPILFGARADQRIAAEKLLGIIITGGAVFLYAAFLALEKADSPKLFLVLLMVNALISAPGWGLLTTIALNSLEDEEKSFGFYRVWGTIGWVVVGWCVSWFGLDDSPKVGTIAAGVRVLAGLCCFFLPHTPPRATDAKGWRSVLGFDSLRIFRDSDHRVYLISTFLLSVPLAAFYMHTPLHLRDLGFQFVAAGMTVGQIWEIVAFLMMGFWMRRVRIKYIMLVAIACGVLRYVLYAMGGIFPHFAWVLVEEVGLDSLKALVTNPLEDMKIAPFYGCYILRPERVLGFDEHPHRRDSLEAVIKLVGATSVTYDGMTKCCGFPILTTNRKNSLTMTGTHVAEAETWIRNKYNGTSTASSSETASGEDATFFVELDITQG